MSKITKTTITRAPTGKDSTKAVTMLFCWTPRFAVMPTAAKLHAAAIANRTGISLYTFPKK